MTFKLSEHIFYNSRVFAHGKKKMFLVHSVLFSKPKHFLLDPDSRLSVKTINPAVILISSFIKKLCSASPLHITPPEFLSLRAAAFLTVPSQFLREILWSASENPRNAASTSGSPENCRGSTRGRAWVIPGRAARTSGPQIRSIENTLASIQCPFVQEETLSDFYGRPVPRIDLVCLDLDLFCSIYENLYKFLSCFFSCFQSLLAVEAFPANKLKILCLLINTFCVTW